MAIHSNSKCQINRGVKQKASESMVNNQEGYHLLVFVTERMDLDCNSELLQSSCTSHDGSATFSTFLFTFADSATKVHTISLQNRSGTQIVVK